MGPFGATGPSKAGWRWFYGRGRWIPYVMLAASALVLGLTAKRPEAKGAVGGAHDRCHNVWLYVLMSTIVPLFLAALNELRGLFDSLESSPRLCTCALSNASSGP